MRNLPAAGGLAGQHLKPQVEKLGLGNQFVLSGGFAGFHNEVAIVRFVAHEVVIDWVGVKYLSDSVGNPNHTQHM